MLRTSADEKIWKPWFRAGREFWCLAYSSNITALLRTGKTAFLKPHERRLKMFVFNRRKLLEVLGKGMAFLGLGFSFLGAGCATKERAAKKQAGAKKKSGRAKGGDFGATYEERAKSEPPPRSATKKIIALSCGSEHGNCETFIRAAAIGAGELGIPTEIIQAALLNVNVLEGDPDDDVPWIHEKTLLEDAALICAVPTYHVRANSLVYAINERMLGVMGKNQWM
jgi:hypothetical protein